MYKEYQGKFVTIMTCSNCNVKCKQCYISYKGNFLGKDLFDMASHLSKKYEILLNGTEPLLHKDYLPCYQFVDEIRPITNGLVFKDNYDYLDELKANNINFIRISYHFDIHDSISQVSKAYLEELFKEILKRGMKFGMFL